MCVFMISPKRGSKYAYCARSESSSLSLSLGLASCIERYIVLYTRERESCPVSPCVVVWDGAIRCARARDSPRESAAVAVAAAETGPAALSRAARCAAVLNSVSGETPPRIIRTGESSLAPLNSRAPGFFISVPHKYTYIYESCSSFFFAAPKLARFFEESAAAVFSPHNNIARVIFCHIVLCRIYIYIGIQEEEREEVPPYNRKMSRSSGPLKVAQQQRPADR